MIVGSNFPQPLKDNRLENNQEEQKQTLWEFTKAKREFVHVQKILAQFSGAFQDLSRLLNENPGTISIENWVSVLDKDKLKEILTEYDLALAEVQAKESKAQRMGCWVQ